MSQHHKNTTNPKYIRMQMDYAERIVEFGARNPYLLSLIIRARDTVPIGNRRFGYQEAFVMMDMLDETGYVERLVSDNDLQDPKVFWTIMDYAKKKQNKTNDSRYIRALVFFYESLDKKGTLGDRFKNAEKSPYPFLRRNSFLKKMCSEYTHSEDVYIIRYRIDGLPALLILPYQNRAIREMVIQSYIRDQTVYTNDQQDLKSLCSMEDVFGPYSKSIRGPLDLNAEILSYAIDYIMRKYVDNERLRTKNMVHIWNIYRYAIMTYPDRPFFADSHLWNSVLILNHRVPHQLAQGYVPAIIEAYGSIPAHKKVLYVYTNGEYYGANGVSYGMFAVDFSSIHNDLYRWLAVNYIAKTDQRRHPIVSSFLSWLEDVKGQKGYRYATIDRIYANEMCSYRHVIATKVTAGGSRNQYIGTIVQFLNWAAGTKQIHLEKGIFKYFSTFKFRHKPKPRSLTTCKRKAIETALAELGKNEPRYLITLVMFKILLRSDIRCGQLCSLDLERMKWNEDGSSVYVSRVKNRGDNMVPTRFSKVVSSLLKDAAELTDDIREQCPIEGPKTCLFLYRGTAKNSDEISVMDVQRFNLDIGKACDMANVPKITSGNVRDTRQTAVAKFAHKHNLSDAQICTLSRHAKRTTLNGYIDLHIDDLLRAAENINLGKLDENA